MNGEYFPKLNKIPPFAGLPADSCKYLQARLRRYDFNSGDPIITPGKRGAFFALVGRGAIVLQESNGETQTLMPGGMFGEGMMRYGVPSSVNARALVSTSLWIITRSDWLAAKDLQTSTIDKSSDEVSKPRKQLPRWISVLLILSLFVLAVILILGSTLLDYTHNAAIQLALQAGRPDLAQEYLELALYGQPDYAHLYDALGFILYLEGHPLESRIILEKALNLDESLASAHNNLGVILLGHGEITEAIIQLEDAVILDPTSADAYYNLGNAYLAARDFEPALKSYQQSYELDSNQIEARVLWASVALGMGQHAAAKEVWGDVLTEDLIHPIANRGLGVIAVLEKDFKSALPYLQIASLVRPDDAIARYYLGVTWQALEYSERAIAEFEAVLALSQDVELIQRAQQHLARIQD